MGQSLGIAVLSVSDSRTIEEDRSGLLLTERAEAAGHRIIARTLVADDPDAIQRTVRAWIENKQIQVALVTGGTGMFARDHTPEAVAGLGGTEIPGFGELFRWLSYESIGSSTLMSRASARLVGGTLVASLPGSPSACRDAWDRILGEQLDSDHRPCNLAELLISS